MNSNQHVLNSVNLSSQATKIAKLETDLQNWNIPNEPFKRIYELGNIPNAKLKRSAVFNLIKNSIRKSLKNLQEFY